MSPAAIFFCALAGLAVAADNPACPAPNRLIKAAMDKLGGPENRVFRKCCYLVVYHWHLFADFFFFQDISRRRTPKIRCR
jgi:hypothetical protein